MQTETEVAGEGNLLEDEADLLQARTHTPGKYTPKDNLLDPTGE